MHRRLSQMRVAVRATLRALAARRRRKKKKKIPAVELKVASALGNNANGISDRAKCEDNENADKIVRRFRYSPAFDGKHYCPITNFH